MRKWVRVKGQLESITISDPIAKMSDANETVKWSFKGLHVSYKVHPTFLYHFADPYGKFWD